MGKEAGHWSSGRRKRKAKLMRAPWDIMTVPYCPLGAVIAGAQWSRFLPHASPPGVNGHPCAFHELLSASNFTSECVGSLGTPMGTLHFTKASPQPLGRTNGLVWRVTMTPGAVIVRLWAGGGQREETPGVQKETRDILGKSQAEQTALQPEAYLNCVMCNN